jgi:hypothetical protein
MGYLKEEMASAFAEEEAEVGFGFQTAAMESP